jgi:hypothetical protein
VIPAQQIERALRFARPVLMSRVGEPEGRAILDAMETNYLALASEVPPLHSYFNRMTLRIAVDVVAFYRALPAELPGAEKLGLTQALIDNWMDGQFDSWLARHVYANRTLHRLYRRIWFSSVNRADEPDGQRFEYLPPEGERFYGVDVLRCGILKFMTRMGVPELTRLICQGDEHIRKYLPPGVEFQRSQVLVEGGTCCDYRYVLRPAAKPPPRGQLPPAG